MSATPRSKTGIGILDAIEWVGNKLPEPAMLFLLGTLLVMVLSQIAVSTGMTVQPKALRPVYQTVVDPQTGQETRTPKVEGARTLTELVPTGTPIRARSLLTADGLYYAISSMVDNFVRFPPLGVVLVGMLGVGVAERSGFIGGALKALMLAVPRKLVTPTIIFLGINSSLATDAGYIVLPPVAAALYKAMGRSPLAGIAAAFAGAAAGFNANLLVTSLDPLLAGLTGPAAQAIDPGYSVNPACNWWFMIASTFLITFAGWFVSDVLVERRLKARPSDDGGPAPVSEDEVRAQRLSPGESKALVWASIAVVIGTLVFVGFKLVPDAPFDDAMRGADGQPVTYAQLADLSKLETDAAKGPEAKAAFQTKVTEVFGSDDTHTILLGGTFAELARLGPTGVRPGDPVRHRLGDSVRNRMPGVADAFDRWAESIVPLILILFLIPGVVYGWKTGSVRGGRDVAKLMTESMAGMAPVIVLSFFAAQFIEYFKFSNLDRMLAYTGGTWLAGANLPPWALIAAFILVTMTFNLLIASMSAKYTLFAPIFVPMLMLAGISPELTQAAYRVGDSVTNILTPLNSYVVIILVVVQRYAPKSGIGTLISMMVPYTIVFTIAWTILIVVWMQTGLELGPNGPLTYVPK